MAKNAPQPPPAPNPYQVAGAQTQSNVETAIANSILGNANEITPYGTVTYRQLETLPVSAPGGSTGSTSGLFGLKSGSGGGVSGGGVSGGGIGYNVPRYERTVAFSPQQQALFDQQNQLKSSLNQLAIDQTGRIGNLLGSPIQAPDWALQRSANAANPALYGFADTAGNIRYDVGPEDFSGDRQRVEAALYGRLEPQLLQQREGLENRLLNQGLVRGTDAFNRAMDEELRAANDARLGVIRQGGLEQDRLFNLAMQQANFWNSAQAQDYAQALGRGQFYNAAQQQDYNQALANAQLSNAAYAQRLQTDLALRNQPINEVSALMSGGQVALPQFASYQGGQVAPVPVGNYVYNSAALQNQQYQQQQAQQNAMLGGLFGLGGAALGGAGAAGGFGNLFGIR